MHTLEFGSGLVAEFQRGIESRRARAVCGDTRNMHCYYWLVGWGYRVEYGGEDEFVFGYDAPRRRSTLS